MSVYGIYQKHLDSKGQSYLCMVWNLSYFPTVDVTLYEVEHLDKISNWSYALVEDRLFLRTRKVLAPYASITRDGSL